MHHQNLTEEKVMILQEIYPEQWKGLTTTDQL
jgi:hypothetical protein